MEAIDSLIHASWVIPVEPVGQVLERHCVAIHQGRIHGVLPSEQARARLKAAQELELPDHVLIPGLINAHTHAAMTLLRGLADDLPLMEWLNRHIWPAEQRWVGADFVRTGSLLAAAEMLCGGTTCYNDMYFYPDQAAEAALEAGIRACVGLIVVDFPTVWAGGPDEYLSKGLEVHEQYRHSPLIHTAFAPHAPYSVADGPLQRVAALAEELDLPVHIHIHETRDEVEQSLHRYGSRPLERLARLGLLSPHLVGVHMTRMMDQEIDAYAEAGAHLVHCPESNMKLASGLCRVQRFMDAGVNVALGTDGCASNNDLDMFGEMRSAALLGKAVAEDARALPAEQVLAMATLNGARALGLEQETGSLVAGKAADLVAVDLGRLRTRPVYHPLSHLVYAAGRDDVTDVWVAGRHVVRQGRLVTVDEAELLPRVREWGGRIAAGEPSRARGLA